MPEPEAFNEWLADLIAEGVSEFCQDKYHSCCNCADNLTNEEIIAWLAKRGK
jgi:hypothetical protein